MASSGSVLLNFLSPDASNPKRRMETAVLDEDTVAMRELVTSGQIGVNDELTAQSALTAMHLAARNDRPNSVRALVHLGADPMIANFLGQTPLDCAMSAKSPRALLELARWAPIGWRLARDTFRSRLAQDRQMDSHLSFTMHLLIGLMQPVRLADPDIVCRCLASYKDLVDATTEWAEERTDPPMRPTRALFPDEKEREPLVTRYVSESQFLLDPLMRPEAFLSALLGVYNCSELEAALIGRGASQSQVAEAVSAMAALLAVRAAARDSAPGHGQPQSLGFACRNVLRRSVASVDNYVRAVYGLQLDFATKAFLVYNREVACVMEARPRTRYTGL